jgi:hypothetical protein
MATGVDVAADKVLHANTAFWDFHDSFPLLRWLLFDHQQTYETKLFCFKCAGGHLYPK